MQQHSIDRPPNDGESDLICEGVRGGDVGFPVTVVWDLETNRPMLRAINEGGFACTEIDLLDLLGWLHKVSPTSVIPDEFAADFSAFTARIGVGRHQERK